MNYQITFTHKKIIAPDTVAFSFKKPDGFSFIAGQFIEMRLLDSHDKRYFSVASAPQEKELMFATRITGSNFKNKLNSITEGGLVEISSPMGRLTMSEVNTPVVFLTGGIGITPFRSMVLDQKDKSFPIFITLFYSNHSLIDAPIFTDFTEISHTNFRFIPTMTKPKVGTIELNGETGRINSEMLKKYLKKPKDYQFLIAGPPGLVEGIKEILSELAIPQKQLMAEEFVGYLS